jgi:hypothetical protein
VRGKDGVTFHDFRGSAVTRLFEAGATVAEIASITGHSLADVEAILDAHYFGRTTTLAESGIAKLERREKRYHQTDWPKEKREQGDKLGLDGRDRITGGTESRRAFPPHCFGAESPL